MIEGYKTQLLRSDQSLILYMLMHSFRLMTWHANGLLALLLRAWDICARKKTRGLKGDRG
jgi:hypothetical protein